MAQQPEIIVNLRGRHQDLLKRLELAKEPEALVPVAEHFLTTCRESGREVASPADREYLQELMSFWANWLFAQTRVYPDTTLLPSAETSSQQLLKQMAPITGQAAEQAFDTTPIPITSPAQQATASSGGGLLSGWVLWASIGVAAFLLVVGLILAGRGVFSQAGPESPDAVESLTPGTSEEPPSEDGAGTALPEEDVVDKVVGAVVDLEMLPGSRSLFVQVLVPSPSEVVMIRDEIDVQLTYSNLQPGWQVFLTMQQGTTGLLFPLTSFTVEEGKGSGIWDSRITIPGRPDEYYIGALVATTSEAAALIKQSEQLDDTQLPPDILPFPRLSVVLATVP